jgi:hypothetical protein
MSLLSSNYDDSWAVTTERDDQISVLSRYFKQYTDKSEKDHGYSLTFSAKRSQIKHICMRIHGYLRLETLVMDEE